MPRQKKKILHSSLTRGWGVVVKWCVLQYCFLFFKLTIARQFWNCATKRKYLLFCKLLLFILVPQTLLPCQKGNNRGVHFNFSEIYVSPALLTSKHISTRPIAYNVHILRVIRIFSRLQLIFYKNIFLLEMWVILFSLKMLIPCMVNIIIIF